MFVTLLVSLEMWRSVESYVGDFETADLGSLTEKWAMLFGLCRRTGRERGAIRGLFICGCDLKGAMTRGGGLRNPVGTLPQVFKFLIDGTFTKESSQL